MTPLAQPPRLVLLGGLGFCVALGSFILGRYSSGPSDAVEVQASSPDAHRGSDHDGHGTDHQGNVIEFSPEARAQAGVRVEAVSHAPVRAVLHVTGTVEPNVSGLVKVTPRVSGKITALRATIGATVRAGQVLATMTSTELATAQAQYRQAGARVAAAAANLRRQRQLAGFGEFGQHKVQDARGNFNAAEGEVNEAQSAIAAARNEVAEAQAALAAAQSEEVSRESDVTAAEAGLAQATTQVEVMKARFQRQDALLKEGLTSRQSWEQARADDQKAQTDVLAAQAAIRSAQARRVAAHARVHQAGSVIETHQAKLEQARARLDAARQRLKIARSAREREEKIYESGIFASREVADAEAALRQAQIDRATAADTVRLLGALPGSGNTIGIASPIAGRVTELRAGVGEMVSPEKPVLTVLNLNTVWVQLNLYQRDLPSVQVGVRVIVTSDAVPEKPFVGRVAYIGDAVDETTRTVRVRCAISNPAGLLKPDMFVRGRITTSGRAPALSVPGDAVQTLEGKSVVFVPGDHEGEFEAREVETGETVDGRTLIRSGLSPGDRIVSRGAFMVKAQAMKHELGHEH